MALHEAIQKGADEAILLDKNGFISEGSGENIFLIKNNIIYTPTFDHCLNGITRQSVMKIAVDMGYEVVEKNLKIDELINSDEAFFTGTAAEVVPINSIDNKVLGNGSRGPITKKLQSTYFDQVRGLRKENANWHTFVSE